MKTMKSKVLFAALAITLSTELTLTQAVYAFPVKNDTVSNAAETETLKSKADISLKLTDDENKISNSLEPVFTITNNESSDISLKDLDIKYYYSTDTKEGQIFSCYYAGTINGDYSNLTSNVKGDIESLGSSKYCAKISFADGTLKTGQSIEIKVGIHKEDWSFYNDSADKSRKTEVFFKGSLISEKPDPRHEDVIPQILTGDVTGKAGEIVKVPVNIACISDRGLSKLDLNLSYDKDVMTLEKIEAGNMLDDIFKDTVGFNNDFDKNKVNLSFDFGKGDGVKPIFKEGTFAYLYFKINKDTKAASTSLKADSNSYLVDSSGEVYKEDTLDLSFKPIKILPLQQQGTDINEDYYKFVKNSVKDDERTSLNDNDPNISIGEIKDDVFPLKDNDDLIFAVTNTSKRDMELNKLNFYFYYIKENPQLLDEFKIDYASILGTNSDLTSYTDCEAEPFYCDWYYNKKCFLNTTFKEKAGVLKPGQTVLVHGIIKSKDDNSSNIRKYLHSPVVTYDGESLYGQLPEEEFRNSEIISKTIEFDSNTEEDISINFKLNSNVFKSIDLYSNGSFVRSLVKDKDYIVSKRGKIKLTRSCLNSLNTKYSTLNFHFDRGQDASIDVINHKYDEELKEGSLTLGNEESCAFGDTGLAGGDDIARWNDLIVPIRINDIKNENIDSGNLILKFNKYLFSKVTVENVNSYIASAEVNYNLGIINIKLNKGTISKDNNESLFNIVFSPSGKIDSQKINLSLSDESYYITDSGIKYKPGYNYNTIELLPKYGHSILTSEDVSCKQGETITIPVFVKNAKYYNISGFNYTLSYDKDIFESAIITPGINISNKNVFSSNNDTDEGTVSVSYNLNNISSNRIEKDGLLMNIVLKVKDDAKPGIVSLSNLDYGNKLSSYSYDDYYSSNFIINMSSDCPTGKITILKKINNLFS